MSFFAISELFIFDQTVLLIPVVSALIGWGTNVLAIRMLFAPTQRIGWKYLGWQGVIPSRAKKMATICVNLLTSTLLDVNQLFQKIEAQKISNLLSPVLEAHAETVVEEIIIQNYPKIWKSIPNGVKQKARQRVREEIPNVIAKLMHELQQDLNHYLDVRTLVIESFVTNKHLINELFWRCGKREFIFIGRSGLIFGGLFGMLQAITWTFVQPQWFLPITGLFVGWATNWIALKMVFEPLEAKNIGPFKWQGLFLRRQPEVSDAYAKFFAEKMLHPKALVNAVLSGPASERLIGILQGYVDEAVDTATGRARALMELTIGSAEYNNVKQEISKHLLLKVPPELNRVHTYAERALDLENVLARNLKELSPPQFEQVLRPIFIEDEKTLIAVGAVLGGIAGIVQWFLVS